MKLPLGKSTRIATARRVLHDVVAKIPDDFNVGLRVYGHRYGSRQKETCTDSELVVPIQKLNRDRLLTIVDSKQPRGETPLVYSVLQTAADLKAVGGGSMILITDGEESCHGDPVAAARELKASGVDINLQILGFTLTGKQVQQELSQFAEATGGRYYGAQDGETLGRALLMAAVDKMTYVILDAAGHQAGQGETDSRPIELTPGEYTVVVRASTGELTLDHVVVSARGESVVKVVIDGGRFQLRR
jgi:Ca-activated chloride channel family protein